MTTPILGQAGSAPNPFALARASVDQSAGAFKTVVDGVRGELLPPGTQMYEEASGYWKVIQYPAAVYACTPENMRRTSFKAELWTIAQRNLAQLTAVTSGAPFSTPLPPIGSPERKYAAALFADWYITAMSWVSLAFYACNVQPGFLLPDKSTTPVPGGQLRPTRTPGDGLPADLETVRREIIGTGDAGRAYADAYLDKGEWGPAWMGFLDRGEATGWLRAEFKPHTDPKAHNLKFGNGGVDYIWPKGYRAGVSVEDNRTTMRSRIIDPWYQCYYTALHSSFGDLLWTWYQHDTTGVNDTNTRTLLGAGGLYRTAQAWMKYVLDSTIMDVVLQSSSWYAANYIAYWQAKGLADYPPSEAAKAATELRDAKFAAKQNARLQIVDSITNTGVSIAAASAPPQFAAIGAAAGLLIGGIARLIARRRRKKQKPVPLMQPLMLRSLSDPACDYFPPNATLASSLERFVLQVKRQTAELDRAPAGVVPALSSDDPLAAGSTTAPVPAGDTRGLTVSPNAMPATTVAGPAGGAAIALSTTVPAGPPVPSVQTIQAAAVQESRTPPTTSGTAPAPGSKLWLWVGFGALGLVGLRALQERR